MCYLAIDIYTNLMHAAHVERLSSALDEAERTNMQLAKSESDKALRYVPGAALRP
jgi:hypothetical protein